MTLLNNVPSQPTENVLKSDDACIPLFSLWLTDFLFEKVLYDAEVCLGA